MRIVFLVLSFLLFGCVFSQDTTKYFISKDYGWQWKRGKFDSSLILPKDTLKNKLGVAQIGTKIYVYSVGKWQTTSATFDTTNIYNELATKQDIIATGTDSQYIKGDGSLGTYIDTNTLSNRINLKLNISDTANIRFRPIAGSNITLSGIYPNITIAGTTQTATGIAGGDLSGTYPNPTVDKIHSIDVQSGVPTANDVLVYGGSPSKWQHQQLNTSQLNNNSGFINSSDASITSKLNISDTLNMLLPYLRKTDTASLSNRINLKISGTGNSNELAYFTGASSLSSLTTSTYPNLTELSYVKGVTSNIQTQLNNKGTFTLPSLTSGSVLFSNGTTVSQNNSIFFWDNTNNRLGIGTNSPSTKFHILGTTGTSEVFRIANEGTNTHTQLSFYNANNLPSSYRNIFSAFQSRGSLASPTALVSGDMTFGINGNGYDGTNYQSSASIDFVTNGTIATGSVPQDVIIRTGTNGGNRATRLTISSTGNVGVGGTGAAKMYIHGEGSSNDVLNLTNELNGGAVNTRFTMINANSTGAAGVGNQFLTSQSRGTIAIPTAVVLGDYLYRNLVAGHDGSGFFSKASMDYIVDAAVSGSIIPTAIIFNTSSTIAARTERLRISSNGNIGIGAVATPTARLHIAAGTATANTAPVKLNAGVLNSVFESGAIETNAGNDLFYSNSLGRGRVSILGYTAISAAYTATNGDYTIDCTTGTFNVTLPTATSITGRTYIIKNSGTGTITIATTSSQTIDGTTTKILSTRYSGLMVQSNGSNWIIIGTI